MGILRRLWPIAVVCLCLLVLAGGIGGVAGSFGDSETSVANSFTAWSSTLWLQTTQADFEAGIPIQANTRSSSGDVGLARANFIFALQGGSAAFWGYNVAANSWASMIGAPNTVGDGGALAYDGARYIYAFRGGGNNRAFWRYDTTLGVWTVLPNAPTNVGAGASLIHDGSRYVYAFRGNNQTDFWAYDTTSNSWAPRTAAPARVGAGGSLAYDRFRYIYAFRGNTTRTFWRYDASGNTWAAMANTPLGGTVGPGGRLVYDGSRYIYAFRGNGQTPFWQYDILSNTWTVLANTPAGVGAGGALAYAGSGYIYAFRGNGTAAFWRYDVFSNSWTSMTNALGNVTSGGSLAFVAASTYVGSATMSSQVRDTGKAGARWDALFWGETLQLNTDITFQVRASDTLFAANNGTLTWTSAGGTSPVTSGLPSGRYMQWRAVLTTSDTAVTPVLHEVRLYHY